MPARIDPGASGLRCLARRKRPWLVMLAFLAGMGGALWVGGGTGAPDADAGAQAQPPRVPAGAAMATGAGTEGGPPAAAPQARGPMQPAQGTRAAAWQAQLTPEQKMDGRVVIAYDMAWMNGKKAGDSLELILPSSRVAAPARIESMTEADGIRTWSGVIFSGDARGRFRISQTMQGGYVIGSLEGPDGAAYTLEARDGLGWVAPQEDSDIDEGGHGEDHDGHEDDEAL